MINSSSNSKGGPIVPNGLLWHGIILLTILFKIMEFLRVKIVEDIER